MVSFGSRFWGCSTVSRNSLWIKFWEWPLFAVSSSTAVAVEMRRGNMLKLAVECYSPAFPSSEAFCYRSQMITLIGGGTLIGIAIIVSTRQHTTVIVFTSDFLETKKCLMRVWLRGKTSTRHYCSVDLSAPSSLPSSPHLLPFPPSPTPSSHSPQLHSPPLSVSSSSISPLPALLPSPPDILPRGRISICFNAHTAKESSINGMNETRWKRPGWNWNPRTTYKTLAACSTKKFTPVSVQTIIA